MRWIGVFLMVVLCVPAVNAADTLIGDDSDRVTASVNSWQRDAKSVAMKSGDRHARLLARFLQKQGVPAIPLTSEGTEILTMRTRLPQQLPQIRIVPVRPVDSGKADAWREVYNLNQIWTYRPEQRLLVGKDVPVSSDFRGISLLGRAEEIESYEPGEILSTDETLEREAKGLLYGKKLALSVYGPKFSNWLEMMAKHDPLIDLECTSTQPTARYYYELEGLMGPSLSADERAERQRQVCLWLLFMRFSINSPGLQSVPAETRALKQYYYDPV